MASWIWRASTVLAITAGAIGLWPHGDSAGSVEPGPVAALPPGAAAPQVPGTGQSRNFVVTYLYNGISPTPLDQECPEGLAIAPDPQVILAGKGYSPAAIRELFSNISNRARLIRLLDSRGANGENTCLNPTLVKDPGMPVGQGGIGIGVDLDGGHPVKGCGSRQLTDPDGTPGIDNQVSRVRACIKARRQGGFFPNYEVGLMHNGEFTILMRIDGIDDLRTDPDITVTLMSSKDPLPKSATGKGLLHGGSFTPDGRARYVNVFKARIQDGVIYSEARDLALPSNQHRREMRLNGARLRLKLQADGTIKGALGGYTSLAEEYDHWSQAGFSAESQTGPFTCEAMYYALKRAADAAPDPTTGECTQISAGYSIEAEPAFITPPLASAGVAR